MQIGSKSAEAAMRMFDRLVGDGILIGGTRWHFQAFAHSIAFSPRGIFASFALAVERQRSP
jgi:hypothetical protein